MSNYETSQTSDLKELINKLRDTRTLSKNEWIRLIDGRTPELADYLFENAREDKSLTMDMMFMSAD